MMEMNSAVIQKESEQRNRIIHVLHQVGSLNRGGIETWLLNLARQASDEVHFDFIVFTPGGTYEDELKNLGCRIYCYPQSSRLRKRLEITGLARSVDLLQKILVENRYDVFHAHGTEFLGDAMKSAANCGIKVRVAHCHTTGIGKFRRDPEMWIRGLRFQTIDRYRILKYATDILAVSSESGRFFM
jgi:hypothetical protein